MWTFLDKINKAGTTIILTTHYLEEAESMCNNIAIIDHGLTIEHTSMRKLLSQINMETFVLYTENEIQHIPDCIADCRLRIIDDHTLEIDMQNSGELNHIFNFLSEHGIKVISMRNKSNRLEQLFMCLVEKNRNNKDLIETLKQTSHENTVTE